MIGNIRGADELIPELQPGLELAKIDFRQEMVLNAREDQKNLLRYVSDAELQDIHDCYNHPLQDELVFFIKSGLWQQLISSKPDLNILKAAFCQHRLDIEDLATAFSFLAPRQRVEEHGEVRTFEEMRKLCGNSLFTERWPDISAVPKHQQFFISVDAEAFEEDWKKDMEAVVNKGSAGVVKYAVEGKAFYALGSAGLIKADRVAKGHPPVFTRGLTPKRSYLLENALKGLSDYALIDPVYDLHKKLHGRVCLGSFPYFHDSYHLALRVKSGILDRKDILGLVLELEKQLEGTALLPAYTTSAITGGEFTPQTINDLVRGLLDYTLANIADGAQKATASVEIQQFMANAINDVALVKEQIRAILDIQKYYEGFLIYLNDRLNRFGLNFASRAPTDLYHLIRPAKL